MRTRVLVTGASGNIGIEVLEQLRQHKEQFVISVFDRETPKSKKVFNKYKNDIQVYYGDIRNSTDTIDPCKNQDFVIHLAALIPPAAYANKTLTHEINVLGTKNLISNLEKFSPHAFLAYSSSVAVYGDRLSNIFIKVTDPPQLSDSDNYAASKIEAEEIIKNSKLRWTIFRLSAIMGAGNHEISPIIFLMPLETPMEITTPEDAARAFVHSIPHQDEIHGKVFNLGGGEKNRILYKDLLQGNFKLYGLGDLDFPDTAFAKDNYHCGYYADGDELENILHFRKDTVGTYFQKVKESIHPLQYFSTFIVKNLVKKSMLKKSQPYTSYKKAMI